METNYASRAVGNAGLTTGIIGTSLGALSTLGGLGGLAGLFGGRANDPQSALVTRYDLDKEQQIAELKSQIALRDANTYNDQKSLELYKYIDGRLAEIGATLAALCIWRGYIGSLPWLSAMVGLPWTAHGVVCTAYLGVAKADHTEGGITYEAAKASGRESPKV